MCSIEDKLIKVTALIDTVKDGILTIGTDGLIKCFNPPCEKIFLYKSDEIIGKPIESLQPKRFHEKHRESLKAIFKTGKPDVFRRRELPALRKNGDEFPIELIVSEYKVKNKHYFIGVIRDITEKHRMMRELQHKSDALEKQNIKLQEGNRLKSEFLANMSHELRTPLNSIIGLTEQLLFGILGDITEKQKKFMGKVLASGKHLLDLINEILDLSKVEAGKLEFNNCKIKLSDFVRQFLPSVEGLFRKKELPLHIDVSPDLPEIYADPKRIKQILLNLVGNAIKFTDRGSISIKALYREASGFVELSIRDTGIGIAEKDRLHIFKAFGQADGSSTRREGGTGLGLTITKKLVEGLNGKIEVESRLGEGAVFTVYLPIQPDLAPESGNQQIDYSKKLILVIEDNRDDLDFLKKNIEKGGDYQVLWSQGGKDGFEKAKKHRPFAIILDVLLPEIDGWELSKWLKENPLTWDIPIIMITVLDNKQKGFSLGVFDYLIKPVDYQKLRETFHRLENRLNNKNELNILVVDDEKNYLKSINRLLIQEGYKVMPAGSGKEALEILEEHKLDLMVTDLMMPDVDGFELIRETNRLKKGNLPIIVNTAKNLTYKERKFLAGEVVKVSDKGDMGHLLLDIKYHTKLSR